MRFSKEVKESPTLRLAELAKNKIAKGEKVINLSIGEPDFKTPKFIIEATKKALDDGFTGYSTPQGLTELREAISKEYQSLNANYSTDEIIIMPGAKNAIFAALASVLEENDEVIIISPYYVSYPPIIKLAEVSTKIIDVPLNDDFSLPLKQIKESINSNTKALILNYPNNPTGKIITRSEMEEIVKVIKKNNIYLLSDEIYRNLPLYEKQVISFASFSEIKEQLIVIDGYSKTYAMTGFRIGYALSSKKIIRKMNLINQNTNTNTNTFVQRGALSIYENNQDYLKKYLKELENRANLVSELISKTSFLKGLKPESGFYYFIDISETKLTSIEFSEKLIELGVIVTPGISFGNNFDNYIRISLAIDINKLEEAFEIIRSLNYNS